MNYWICITNQKNWDIINDKGVWGVSQTYMNILSQVEMGDKILFYIKGGKVKGIFMAISKMYKNNEKVFNSTSIFKENEIFPYRINIKRISNEIIGISVYNILQNLKITKDKKNWGACFFRAMIKISIEDYKILEQKMKAIE